MMQQRPYSANIPSHPQQPEHSAPQAYSTQQQSEHPPTAYYTQQHYSSASQQNASLAQHPNNTF